MCSVVIRWLPEGPVLLLALRDEMVTRDFDDPDFWWPEQPTVVGGRDRQSGGTWCATDIRTGDTALVLNRAQRPTASPGAQSRGALPLLLVRYGRAWSDHLDLTGMASFAVILASSQEGTWLWEFDGRELAETSLPAGTHMITSGPYEEGRIERHLPNFLEHDSPEGWRTVVQASEAGADPTDLLIDCPHEGSTFATVFAQVMQVQVGRMTLNHSRSPAVPVWETRTFQLG